MRLVIGLTGGIGSGKTAVSDRFEQHGITLADADVAARRVVEPGKPALKAIVQHFGQDLILANGTLDRAKMRSLIFSDRTLRKQLESITVPAILKELRQILDTSTSAYSLLMLSSGAGQSPWIDRNLVVDVPAELQYERVMARDANSRAQIKAIMDTQPSREARLAYADDIIKNDTDLEHLHQQIDTLHKKYLLMASA